MKQSALDQAKRDLDDEVVGLSNAKNCALAMWQEIKLLRARVEALEASRPPS